MFESVVRRIGRLILVVLLAVKSFAVTIETVPVGNLGNRADSTGLGAVNYEYSLGKYEVTAGQYTDFLNAVGADDTYGLYNPGMVQDPMGCQIQRHGAPGKFTYTIDSNWANRPANYVTWCSAARFCNWLHNGQPSGKQNAKTTEDGAYFLHGIKSNVVPKDIYRTANSKWFLPRANEWYKAAYHKNDGDTSNYFKYPTGNDSLPLPAREMEDPSQGKYATYNDESKPGIGAPYFRTEVGKHENSAGPYGTFDQAGNVWEWIESFKDRRELRGGSFGRTADNMLSTSHLSYEDAPDSTIGFRVANNPTIKSNGTVLLGGQQQSINAKQGSSTEILQQAVFFGFDPIAFPERHNIAVEMIAGKSEGRVLGPGPTGSADDLAGYYGSIAHVGDEFRMWYTTTAKEKNSNFACYAISKDGVHWEKPDLELVEYNGSKHNNIIPLPFDGIFTSWVVYFDPDDPQSERRFKMAANAMLPKEHHTCVAFSADGIHWQMPEKPVLNFFEMSGATKFQGNYYLAGQASLPRRMYIYRSPDFVNWTPCGIGFERDHLPSVEKDEDVPKLPDGDKYPGGVLDKEQIHCGAGLWNRGNVILGVYGQWHGRPIDRRRISMDLGIVLSHDGLEYVEPSENFKFIDARKAPYVPKDKGPALMQGQGMDNVGDKTYCWYGYWHVNAEDSGVCLATWDRDRLGFARAIKQNGYMVSEPFQIRDGAVQVCLNVTGLGKDNRVRISLVDAAGQPIAGFSGKDAAVIEENGLSVPVTWKGDNSLKAFPRDVRLQVDIDGEQAQLFAVYLNEAATKN